MLFGGAELTADQILSVIAEGVETPDQRQFSQS
jgi:EAL domain-containing protein (putative c-di-GMP-specific phosphodiesterase class I)